VDNNLILYIVFVNGNNELKGGFALFIEWT